MRRVAAAAERARPPSRGQLAAPRRVPSVVTSFRSPVFFLSLSMRAAIAVAERFGFVISFALAVMTPWHDSSQVAGSW
jgi:hypothetical protein